MTRRSLCLTALLLVATRSDATADPTPPADPAPVGLPPLELGEGVWVGLKPGTTLRRAGGQTRAVGLPTLYCIHNVEHPTGPAGPTWYWVGHDPAGWVLDREVIDPDEAGEEVSRRIAANPKDAALYKWRGLLALGKGRAWIRAGQRETGEQEIDRAIAEFSQAIAHDAKDPEFPLARGFAYHLRADLTRSLVDLSRAVDLATEPAHAEALFEALVLRAAVRRERAVAYRDASQFDPALADLNRAISLRPANPTAYAERLRTLAERNRPAPGHAPAATSRDSTFDGTDAGMPAHVH
jgi:hypothetical protein